MGESASDVLDGGAQGRGDVGLAQGMQIAAERALAAIKEAIGEVLQGEEPPAGRLRGRRARGDGGARRRRRPLCGRLDQVAGSSQVRVTRI